MLSDCVRSRWMMSSLVRWPRFGNDGWCCAAAAGPTQYEQKIAQDRVGWLKCVTLKAKKTVFIAGSARSVFDDTLRGYHGITIMRWNCIGLIQRDTCIDMSVLPVELLETLWSWKQWHKPVFIGFPAWCVSSRGAISILNVYTALKWYYRFQVLRMLRRTSNSENMNRRRAKNKCWPPRKKQLPHIFITFTSWCWRPWKINKICSLTRSCRRCTPLSWLNHAAKLLYLCWGCTTF